MRYSKTKMLVKDYVQNLSSQQRMKNGNHRRTANGSGISGYSF
jgi:hypothetical protein